MRTAASLPIVLVFSRAGGILYNVHILMVFVLLKFPALGTCARCMLVLWEGLNYGGRLLVGGYIRWGRGKGGRRQ